jgi:exopolysaccharide biosynthesis polyprenyl glycosylphosphotransferase
MSTPQRVYAGQIGNDIAPQLVIKSLNRAPQDAGLGLGAVFAFFDAVIMAGSGLLAYAIYVWLFDHAGGFFQNGYHFRLGGFLTCYALLTLLCNAAQNLYAAAVLHSAQISRLRTLKSLVLSSLLTVMLFSLSGVVAVPPLLLASTMSFSLGGLLILRYAMQRHNLNRIERGLGVQHVLIVGSGPIGHAFQEYLQTHRSLGKMFCGFVSEEPLAHRWLGRPCDLPRLLREHFVDEVYFTPDADRELIMNVAMQARQEGISVKVVPDLYDGLALGATVTHIGNVPVLELNRQPIPAVGLLMKRIMDLSFATLLTILTAPLMLAVAIAIKLDSRGPILYAAWRVGQKGRRFRCFKFRTMMVDADDRKEKLRHMNERNGATFKISNDPRITRIGRFLRRYSIDELPQLINVFRGDMSMVGPRPHPVDDYAHYQLADLRRLDVLPGITGLWQVNARTDPSFERNVMLDLEYIQNWTVCTDLKILLKTVPEVLRGAGV